MTNLREMTQATPVGRGTLLGANGAAWKLSRPTADQTRTVKVRPLKKHGGGCKTCDGVGCVGRCRF
jgi:hypothetical protein